MEIKMYPENKEHFERYMEKSALRGLYFNSFSYMERKVFEEENKGFIKNFKYVFDHYDQYVTSYIIYDDINKDIIWFFTPLQSQRQGYMKRLFEKYKNIFLKENPYTIKYMSIQARKFFASESIKKIFPEKSFKWKNKI